MQGFAPLPPGGQLGDSPARDHLFGRIWPGRYTVAVQGAARSKG